MEYEFRMANIMGLLKDDDTSKPPDHRKARIFEEEPTVCQRFDRKNNYDPDSLKKAFHPLGVFSKIFGLFPCYDFSFLENANSSPPLNPRKLPLKHILEYIYSAFIFLLLISAAIVCVFYQPTILKSALWKFEKGNTDVGMDYGIKLILLIATLACGVQSLFIFPTKWQSVMKIVQLISNIDKILRFDGRQQERCFALNLLYYMIGCLAFTFFSYLMLFVYDGKTINPCAADYILVPTMTLALMGLVIPTGLSVFFLNAIRLRMEHYNRKLGNMLKCFIPVCGNCTSFQDYGNDLGKYQMDKQKLYDLPEDLEKMRILHCEIRSLGNCLSCIFGMHLVRDFLYSLVALTLYSYLLLYCQKDGVVTSVVHAGQGIFVILKILILSCFTQLICYQGIVLEGILQRVSLRRLTQPCSLQIQAFMAVTTKKPVISASGFFHVNKALMTSFAASITTYFIILIQFKLNGQGQHQNVTVSDSITGSTRPMSESIFTTSLAPYS